MQEKKQIKILRVFFIILYYRRNNRRTQVGQTENGIIPRSPQNGEFDDFFPSHILYMTCIFLCFVSKNTLLVILEGPQDKTINKH